MAAERELKRELRALATDSLRASKLHITADIYAKPVDKRKNGNPKWTRTGQLRRGERLVVDTNTWTAQLVNDMNYAEPRHEANKPGRRQINPARTAHWRDEALAEIAPTVGERVRQALQRALREA